MVHNDFQFETRTSTSIDKETGAGVLRDERKVRATGAHCFFSRETPRYEAESMRYFPSSSFLVAVYFCYYSTSLQ